MNTFVTHISINFSLIAQPSQMTELPGALGFSRSNGVYEMLSQMKLVCCLSWKTLIFHYGKLLWLPADTHPWTQSRRLPCRYLTGSPIFRKTHYGFIFFQTQIYNTQCGTVDAEKQD
ncbi:hypothetical protein AMECASPLE_028426 [Ameca splendens]|uniref:Uncharacterized protein n=1 Tax=Ameca splendens TaxID=208324 RepID=A0ABV1ACP0_9TELE